MDYKPRCFYRRTRTKKHCQLKIYTICNFGTVKCSISYRSPKNLCKLQVQLENALFLLDFSPLLRLNELANDYSSRLKIAPLFFINFYGKNTMGMLVF